MRKLFLFGTGIFWLAVLTVWAGSKWLPPDFVEVEVSALEKRIPMSEVALHSSDADCWMVIDGSVFDLTLYLPDHPSKPSIILQWCGMEASEAYRTKTTGRSHSPEADQMLVKYRIGTLSGGGN